jgi:hypothetical protein
MNVEVRCPACGNIAKVANEHIGKKAACPKCRSQFILTAIQSQAPPPEPQPVVAEVVSEPIAAAVVEVAASTPTQVKPKGFFGSLFAGKRAEDGSIESYSVVYKGGHPDYPKEKAGGIEFKFFDDRFEFSPTLGTKSWFKGLVIPFNRIHSLDVVERQVGSVEGLLGGLNSRQLNQPNNIHIRYDTDDGKEILLRLEMLTGVTVMGQAKKCQEFFDRIRNHGIREKFQQPMPSTESGRITGDDIPTQIEKLAALREKGILTKEEFDKKKSDLLAKM